MAHLPPRTDSQLLTAVEREAVHVLRELLRFPDEKIRLKSAKTLHALWLHYARQQIKQSAAKN